MLSKIQKEKGINETLKLPAKTRWGSNLSSLQSLLKNKNALQILAIHDELTDKIPQAMKTTILDNAAFWQKVESAIKLLEPIFAMETNELFIHKVHSSLNTLANKTKQFLSCDNIFKKDEKAKILKNLEERKKFS